MNPRELGYDTVARALLELCPLRGSADVVGYLDRRRILADAEAIGAAALPAVDKQPALVRVLLRRFERDVLEAAGVLRPGTSMLQWREHRLILPWFERSGGVTSLQRRTLGAREPKYVFPQGFAPRAPFGAELFDRALAGCAADPTIIVTEGALETLFRRKRAREWRESAIVLGAPSTSIPLGVEIWRPFIAGRDVRIAFDSDAAGAKAAMRFADVVCSRVARSSVRERLEGAKDFGEVVNKEIIR